MDMVTMCPCTSENHGIPHWTCVFRCCEKCPGISITYQKTNKDATNMCSTIRFHVYCNVLCCTVNFILPYKERKICSMCSTYISSVTPGKVYTLKDIVLL